MHLSIRFILTATAFAAIGCADRATENPNQIRCEDSDHIYYCEQSSLCCFGVCVPNSEENCGICGRSCSDHELCERTANGSYACVCPNAQTGITQSCALTCCAPGCVDIKQSQDNCGACGIQCPSGQYCQDGLCQCVPPFEKCGLNCTDLKTNREHCGACHHACPDASDPDLHLNYSICTDGQCMAMCAEGFINLDGILDNGCETPASN